MAIDITLQIPTLTAENILRELRETTRALMTEHKFTYGWSHVFIPRTGGTIFASFNNSAPTLISNGLSILICSLC